jgi:tetratricopeptide (TPR) repeat protein
MGIRHETFKRGANGTFKQENSRAGFLKKLSEACHTDTLQLTIIAVVSTAVYVNTLFSSFVSDDAYQILYNPWIRSVRFIPEIFSHSVWGFYTTKSPFSYYRPMMHLIYMFNYHVFGANPWGFHLISTLFNSGISVLVFIIAKHFLAGFSSTRGWLSPAFIAAMLFATHPVHTEAVAWISALPELAFTFFCLLSLYLYVRFESELKGSYSLSLMAFFLALLSKETALVLPIIIIAYDCALAKDGSGSVRKRLKRYVPYLLIVGLYFLGRSYAVRDVAPVEKVAVLSAYGQFINVLSFFMQYMEKLIFPVQLNAYHIFHPLSSILEPRGLLALTNALAFVVFIAVALKTNKLVFWCLALVIVPLLPTFYIIGNAEVGISERYLYLPSLGFVLLLAVLVDKIRAKKPKMTVGLGIILLLVIGSYSFGTISRSSVWKDEYTLWADTVKKSPDSAFVHRSLGSVLFNKGFIDEALTQFLLAAQLTPNNAETHMCLGATYSRKGMMDKAVANYSLSLLLNPFNWEADYGLGDTYVNMGRVDEGIEQLQRSLSLKPDFPDAHKDICCAFLLKGMLDKALEHCRIAVKLNPNDSDGHYKLAVAYKKNGATYKAIDEYGIALRLMPTAAAYNGLGELYDSMGMYDKAIEQYQAAIERQPHFAMAYNNLGMIYVKLGLFDRAVEYFTRAVRLSPDNRGFYTNLEQVCRMRARRCRPAH